MCFACMQVSDEHTVEQPSTKTDFVCLYAFQHTSVRPRSPVTLLGVVLVEHVLRMHSVRDPGDFYRMTICLRLAGANLGVLLADG